MERGAVTRHSLADRDHPATALINERDPTTDPQHVLQQRQYVRSGPLHVITNNDFIPTTYPPAYTYTTKLKQNKKEKGSRWCVWLSHL